MADNQELTDSNVLDALSSLEITDTYTKTTWTDGADPPLDAQHLQNIEDALALIFLDSMTSNDEPSIINRIVTAINDVIDACKTHEDHNNTDFRNLLTQLDNAKNELDDSKLSISEDHRDITDVKALLDEVVKQIQAYVRNHNEATDVHSDIRDKIESLESTMSDKYIKTEDDLILYCGDSIKNTFTKA